MKKIFLMASLALLLVACGGKSGSGESVAFLEKLGVKTENVTVLGDSLVISLDKEFAHLDAEQTVKLCGAIEPDVLADNQNDGGDVPEGLFSVAAAKAMPGDVALLFLWHEFGDGGVMYACTYDADGKFLDGIELGPWKSKNEMPGDGTYQCEEESNSGVFNADGFVLNRTLAFTQKEEDMTAKWAIEKTYTYLVDKKGVITLKDTKVNKNGNVPADRLLTDEIQDVARMSAKDARIFDTIDKLAARNEVKQSEDHGYEVAVALASVFQRYPADVVAWAAQHRDGALMTALQNAVETGAIEKKAFDTEVEKLSDAEAKAALAEKAKSWKVDATFDDEEGEIISDDFEAEDFPEE